MRLTALVPLVLLAALAAHADVYRWTDDKGVVHYTDKPPSKDAKPVELPQLQTYKPGAPVEPVAGAAVEPEAKPATPAGPARITAPLPEETIRDAEGKVSIAVEVDLQPGEGMVYYLDGKAQNPEPTPSTGYLLNGVERGEHQVGAAVVDANGRERVRAKPVTIFVMPPQVRKR